MTTMYVIFVRRRSGGLYSFTEEGPIDRIPSKKYGGSTESLGIMKGLRPEDWRQM